jgi:hypothetical protein
VSTTIAVSSSAALLGGSRTIPFMLARILN